ncbi:hypothetical protein EVAR_36122_1 [Eumeta japonica]|uniref:Uncharacterized protein n=1 Tax=Eumeta variegata TaxID=151549 RepID=A0A4C1X2X1_EUMVA|nr:hypothetical protein EVAR_36122_1 [Eumeta japonica]
MTEAVGRGSPAGARSTNRPRRRVPFRQTKHEIYLEAVDVLFVNETRPDKDVLRAMVSRTVRPDGPGRLCDCSAPRSPDKTPVYFSLCGTTL